VKLHLRVWRQAGPEKPGKFVDYDLDGISADMSFLEMLDTLNLKLVRQGEEAVEFEHDCREGICGSCSMTIDGNPHGPDRGTATCQLHMRRFADGATIHVEPWRAKPFPIIRDLTVDRSALDRIIAKGGFISVNTGNAPEANTTLIGRDLAEAAFEGAACIGCGACVAACKNASASLFTSAKISHLAKVPQGHPERKQRVQAMVAQMDAEGFGSCSNTGACEAACPKEIKLANIAEMNREWARSFFVRE
jgi:succinate dehydrogenase / fumarate reductase, iron-sulfur subunit